MDSLNDILGRKDLDEPGEIAAIKAYVQRHFKSDVGVKLGPNAIVITAASAALASTLRMQTPDLQRLVGADKKLIFRISG